jgi:hypothetical protein
MLPHSRGTQETAAALTSMIGTIEAAHMRVQRRIKVARGGGFAG